MIASRLRRFRDDPKNAFSSELLMKNAGGLRAVLTLWTHLAHEFVHHSANRTKGVVAINFTDWHQDASYRQEVAHRLGFGESSEALRQSVATYGFGSSFDGMEYDGRASEMNLQSRWVCCVDDPLFRAIFETNDEVHALSDRIFGSVFDGHEVPDWLRNSLAKAGRFGRESKQAAHNATIPSPI
jgi:hypothetical protein